MTTSRWTRRLLKRCGGDAKRAMEEQLRQGTRSGESLELFSARTRELSSLIADQNDDAPIVVTRSAR